jgi:hypothetical protein
MYSIDFTSFLEASGTFTGIVDGISTVVVVVVVLNPTTSNGIKTICTLYSFSLINFSNSVSISFIYAFFSMISFNISSLWASLSTMSFSCESSVARSFNFFLKEAISTFFFFNNSSAALTFDGSYPIFSTKYSRDLILLSLAKEDIFSSFNWDWMLFKDTCNFEEFNDVFFKVEKIISPVFLCMSIWSTEWNSFASN